MKGRAVGEDRAGCEESGKCGCGGVESGKMGLEGESAGRGFLGEEGGEGCVDVKVGW